MNSENEYLTTSPVFKGLTSIELKKVSPYCHVMQYEKDSILIQEEEQSSHLFLIQAGTAKILKSDENARDFEIAQLGVGDVAGAFNAIESKKRSATVKSITPMKVILFDIAEFLRVEQDEKLYSKIIKNIALYICNTQQRSNTTAIQQLKTINSFYQTQMMAARFIIYLFSYIAFYMFMLRLTVNWVKQPALEAIISVFIGLSLFLLVLIVFIRSSYPLSSVGISTRNLKRTLIHSLLASVVLCLGVLLLKALYLFYLGDGSQALFSGNLIRTLSGESPLGWQFALLLPIAYIISVPIQEFIARGCFQSALEVILMGKNKAYQALLIANLLFSILHIYLSELYAVLVFIPGLVWGYIYLRDHNLAGIVLSHIIVGLWLIYIVGFPLL